jgi:hypothetical protein
VREILAKVERDKKEAAEKAEAAKAMQSPDNCGSGSSSSSGRTGLSGSIASMFRSPTTAAGRASSSPAGVPGLTPQDQNASILANASPLSSSPGFIMPRQIQSTNVGANMAAAVGLSVDSFIALEPEPSDGMDDEGRPLFSYQELLRRKHQRDYDGVVASSLESHLTDTSFETVFRMDKASYAKIPQWKKTSLKQKALLF